ncbi:MAG: tRNA pseudouridine(38-40) synthase TruA [Pseudobdellovibrio sp.]
MRYHIIMPRIKFTVSYDGTDFCGWQRQTATHENNTKPSLCHTLEKALEKVFHHPISLSASGRTDAGVHALNQVCHFDTTRDESRMKNWDLGWALRSKLPDSIVVKKAWIAPEDFHSTISAEKKTYRYLILNAQRPSSFNSRFMGWVRKPMDLDYFNECSQYIKGEHDFKSFQSVGTDVAHTIRTIYKAEWSWRTDNVAQFTITGSGFLKQMVRNIVGTQLLAHRKSWTPDKMQHILLAQDRREAGPPAEPQGLYLLRVYYPQDLDNKCREL